MNFLLCANESEYYGTGSSSISILQQQQQAYLPTLHAPNASSHHLEERPLTARATANITTEEPTLRTQR
jgi:hypothetical protein